VPAVVVPAVVLVGGVEPVGGAVPVDDVPLGGGPVGGVGASGDMLFVIVDSLSRVACARGEAAEHRSVPTR
jgi:hypothetical protein